jgi:hypothetical protein|tara:strand:- start:1167 stop:2135 length:969 start_codon:yes stop_codon:yes gene_type:complete
VKVPAVKDLQTAQAKIRQGKSPNRANYLGIRGDYLPESYILPDRAPSEKRFAGENGQLISMIRDTETDIGTGYGNQTGAAAISVAVGFNSENAISTTKQISRSPGDIEPVFGIRDMEKVAAEVYISQKTRADRYFADGNIGSVNAKSAITMKADGLRMWAVEGVKFVTGGTEKNSGGGKVRSVPRFNFIAGNDDSDLQPVAKADSLNSVIEDLYDHIDKLNSMLDSFITSQTEFNTELMTHQHFDLTLMLIGLIAGGNPFAVNDGKTLQSSELISKGMKTLPAEYSTKIDAVLQKLQVAIAKIVTTNPAGHENASSPSLYTT